MATSLSSNHFLVEVHSHENINSGAILSFDAVCAGLPVI